MLTDAEVSGWSFMFKSGLVVRAQIITLVLND